MKKILLIFFVLISILYSKESFLKKANDAFNSGEFNEAKSFYQRALLAGENKAIIYYNLGNLYVKETNMAKAAQSYLDAIDEAPYFTAPMMNLAKLAYSMGDYLYALKMFKRIGESEKLNAEIDLLIGLTYEALEVYDLALYHYRLAQKKTPSFTDAYRAESSLALRHNDLDSALYTLKEAFAENPSDAVLLEEEGTVYRKQEKYIKASASYTAAYNRATNDSERYYYMYLVGECMIEGGYFSVGIEYFKKAFEIKKTTSLARYISYLYMRQDRIEEAFEFLSSAEGDIGFLNNEMRLLLAKSYNNENYALASQIINWYEKNGQTDNLYRSVKKELENKSFGEK